MFNRVFKKMFIFIYLVVFSFLFINVYEMKRIEALDVPTKVEVSYHAILDDVENIEKTYVHNHSVTYRTIKSGIVDTTGHIELISPSSSSDSTISSFYKKNNKVKVTVAYNSVGPNNKNTIEKEYDQVITGWKLVSIKYAGNVYTSNTPGIPLSHTIGDIYAENGFLNISPGIEGFAFEAVYGRAIYVKSPYDKMYYDKWFCFKEGANPTNSDDENFGTNQDDAVCTFRRAYELINASTSLTVFDTAFVLCGRQYEVHRYTETTSGKPNYDYTTINNTYAKGTYQNYFSSKVDKRIVNRAKGTIATATANNACVFGLNQSLDKPVTITSMKGQKFDLVMQATRYDFIVSSSLRFDNVTGRFVANDEKDPATTVPSSYQLNYTHNYLATLEATENFVSNANVNIRFYDSPSIKINGGKWGITLTNSYNGFNALDAAGYNSNESGTVAKCLNIKVGYFEKGKIVVGGKAIISNFVFGALTSPSSSIGSHIGLLNMHDIEINGGEITTLSLTGSINGSNIGGFSVVDGKLTPVPGLEEDINLNITGGYIDTLYGANTGSLNGDVNIDITGGVFKDIYCGGKSYVAEVTGDVNFNMNNAIVNGNIYGGGYGGLVDGNVNMNISNSTIQKNIYGSGKGTVDTFQHMIVVFNTTDPTLAVTNFNSHAANFIYTEGSKDNKFYFNVTSSDNLLEKAPAGFPYYNVEENEYITRVYHQTQQTSDQSYARLIAIKQKLSLSEVTGNININLDSVKAKTVYGGGSIAKVEGNIDISVTGASSIQNLFGACDGSESIANVTLYAPIKQEDYVKHTFPSKGTTKSQTNDNNQPLGSFKLIYDEDVLAIGGIYDGKNKVIYNQDGSQTTFAMYPNQEVINRLVTRYGTQQILFVANSGDFADVKGTVKITVDCDPVYKNGTEQDYNINHVYGGNNSAGEVLGSGSFANITDPNIADYAGNSVVINIKNAVIYTLYGGSNKSDCNYVSNVLIEGGRIFHVYGGCNEADILGTAVEVKDAYIVQNVYGGNNTSGSVKENTMVSIGGAAKIKNVYGGSNLASNNATSYVYINSGTITSVYGGSNSADIKKTNVFVNDGKIENVYGGNNTSGEVASSTSITINNGNITSLFGGGNYAGNDYNTNIVVNNGNITTLYGGGDNGDIANADINLYGGTFASLIYGGGNAGNAKDINLLFDGAISKNDIYGGGNKGSCNEVVLEMKSGSTTGNVFGGGYQGYTKETKLILSGATVEKDIYGGGNAGDTDSTTINITDGNISGTIYGAGLGETSTTDNVLMNINHSVNDVYGGGYAGSAQKVIVNLNNNATVDYVYGGGYQGYTKETELNITGTTVKKDIYGGGNAGRTDATTVNVSTPNITGYIYGAGLGATSHTKNVILNVNDTTQVAYVYGGGNAGSADNVIVNVNQNATSNYVFGGGYQGYTKETEINITEATINNDIFGGGNAGDTDATTINIYSSTLSGYIYGAGLGATSHTEDVTVNIYSNANRIYGGGNAGSAGSTNVNIYKGTIEESIYGGGYVGVTTSTNVCINDSSYLGQVLIKGSIFGGGEGTQASVFEETNVEINLATKLSVEEELEDMLDISGISQVSVTLNGTHSKILGSIYGGGDLGQVGKGMINAVNNTATIDQESSVKVTVFDGYIEGSVFGGGNGTPIDPSTYTVDMGAIFGSTETRIYRGYIYGNVYGGGKQSRLYSNSTATNVFIIQRNINDVIVINGSVFGGGDRGSATATNASVPTTIGDAYVKIENKTSSFANIYFINGGVYGDGNFCLVRGYRSIEMKNFTTNEQGKLKTFFSLQRADEVILNNTDIVLKGAKDLVDEEDNDLYSINRISLISFINGSTIKLVNIVKYLESIESDYYGFYYDSSVKKHYANRIFINDGYNGSNGYNSSNIVNALTEEEVKAYNNGEDEDLFNYICVANGLYLEIKQENDTYGSITGLFGLELLRANEGEGGGFVYADIATSTGDFVCNTKLSSNPDIYMNVVDNVGGLNKLTYKYRYYYWYIEGSIIDYDFNVTGYIGSEEELYFQESILPTTNMNISYVLKNIHSTKLQSLIDSDTYQLTNDISSLTGNEIAIEICIGEQSLGFVTYSDHTLFLDNKTGYGDNQNQIINNILQEINVTNLNNTVYVNLYKSKDVNTETKNIDIELTIELFEQRYSDGVYVYDKYSKTSKLDFNLYFSIVRFVPQEAIYSGVSKQYLGPSSIEGISITSKSSFTYEYQTKYIPGAYPITIDGINSMRWILTTLCYEYYFEPNTGYYLTVQVAQDGTRTIINKTNDIIVGVDDINNDNKRYYFVLDDVKYYFNMLEKQESSYFPKGTKITLVDLTSTSTPMYFFYKCDENISSINLFEFVQMGSTTKLSTIANDGNNINDPAFLKLYQENLLTRITERLIFVFDFSETVWDVSDEFSGFITLEHIYNSHDILDYVSSNEEVIDGVVHVAYNRVTPKGEKFNVSLTADGIGSFEADFVLDQYEEKESAELVITIDQLSSYINTQIEEGRIGVLLSMKNGNKLPDGIVFVYNNNFYPAYGNMHVAIPLINYGKHTISITNLLGTLGQHDDGSSRLISQFDVELCVLPDDRYYSKIDFVTDVNKDVASVEVIKRKDYSIKVESSNRIIGENKTFIFDVYTNSNTPLEVVAYLNGEQIALNEVFKRHSSNIYSGQYAWALVDDIKPGIYQLKFTNKIEEEYISFIVPE